MVGPLGIARNCHGHADDAEEHEHQGPPGEVGEAAADGGYYACDKGNDPGELGVLAEAYASSGGGWLTMPMEMVASAKGSPMMRLTLKELARWLL